MLKVISRSTFDLQVVLNTFVELAARLCDSDHAWLFRRDGEVYRWATGYGLSREGHEQIRQYQQAYEDDAERAVRAGLELVAAVSDLKTHAALQTRVGIATGLVVVGDLIGSGASQEQAIVGETPNLAARLQGVAEPNSVVDC